MKVGKVIRDTQIKAIKTHLKDTTIGFDGFDYGWEELKNAVIKIVNVRKYKRDYWSSNFTFEFDVVVDMRYSEGYYYSNGYCERFKKRCNGDYRSRIAKMIMNEIKYFGSDPQRDGVDIKKITYKEIV